MFIFLSHTFPLISSKLYIEISSSVQFSCSVVSNSLQPRGLQHARLPCPSPPPEAGSNSCPSSRWCHPTILSSVFPFSSYLQSFPASGSFPMSQFFTPGGQSIEASASASDLPMNIRIWFLLGLTGWISLQSKGSKRYLQHHSFKSISSLALSFLYRLILTSIHEYLEKPYFWVNGPLLAKSSLCFLICYLSWS